MAKQLNVNLSLTADTSQAKAQLSALQTQLSGLSNFTSIGSRTKITDDLMKASTAATKLKVALEQATDVNTGKLNLASFNQNLNKAGLNLSQTRTQLNAFGAEGRKAFLGLANAIQMADAPIVNIGAGLKEVMNTFTNTIRWQIASSAIHAITGSISQAFRYAKDLDKSLNNIQIVSGQSADQMAKFAKEANRAAKSLDSTTKKYTEAALIFYQQGLSTDEVTERTKVTMQMANVTKDSADEVSSYMTAIWNNFDDGSKSLEYFGDVITALGATTASSSAEIAGGLEKFAAIGDTIGLSYEYAASALATIVATTRQSEDVVGTALKTIFARIQGLKLGETLDDGVSLNKYSTALQTVGISIFDTTGQLKDMDAILDEMGARWSTLGKSQQVALAQTVAGVRQYNQLISLMDNWDFMKENLNTAYTSEGTLEEQSEIYAESWEAARRRVDAALEGLFDTLIDEDFFKDLLNGIEKIITFVDTLVGSMGGLKGILLVLGTVLTKTFSTQIADRLRGYATTISDIGVAIHNRRVDRNGGDASQKKKTSAQVLRDQATAELSAQSKAAAQTGDYAGYKTYEGINKLQDQFLQKNQIMSESEKQITRELISRQQAYGEAWQAAQKETQEVITQTEYEIRLNNERIKNINLGKEAGALKGISSAISDYEQIIKRIQVYNQELAKQKSNQEALTTAFGNFGFQINKDTTLLEIVGKAYNRVDMAMDNVAINLDSLSKKQRQAYNAYSDLAVILTDVESAVQKQTRAQMAFVKGLDNATKEIDKMKGNIKDFKSYMVNTMQGLSSFALGLTSLSSGINTINESIKEGKFTFQDFSSILMSLSMGIPMMAQGMSVLRKAYLGMIASSEIYRVGLIFEAEEYIWVNGQKTKNTALTSLQILLEEKLIKSKLMSNLVNKASLLITRLLNKELTLSQLLIASISVSLIAIIAVIAALVIGIKFMIKEWNKDADALKNAKKATEDAKNTFNDAKNAFEDLKSTITDNEAAVDAIAKLKEGTTEWYAAIQNANTQVMELIAKYPQLAKYLSEDSRGVLSISEEGKEELLKAENAKVMNSQRQYMAAQANELEARNANDVTNFVRSNPLGGGKSQIEHNGRSMGSSTTGARSVVNELRRAYEREGIAGITYSADQLASKFGISVESANQLLENEIQNLIVSLDANTKANNLLKEQMASSALSQHVEGYNDYQFKKSADQYLNAVTDTGSEGYKKALEEVEDFNKDELAKYYALRMGIDDTQIKERGGTNMIIVDENGGEREISKEQMRKELAQERAYFNETKRTTSFMNKLLEASSSIGIDENSLGADSYDKIATGLVEALTSDENLIDFVNTLTVEEYNAVKEANVEAIAKLYDGNKEYFNKLGYDSAEAISQSFSDALELYNPEEAAQNAKLLDEKAWQASYDEVAAATEEDVDAIEGYIGVLQDLYPELNNNRDAAKDMAKANISFAKGFDSLVEVLGEDLGDLSDNSVLTQQNLAKIGNAYKEMMGVQVSNNFVARNFKELKKLADGNFEVIEKLQEEAAKDYIIHLEVEDNAKAALWDAIDDLTARDLEIGGTVNLDDAGYIKTLNGMLEAGKITAEQIQEAFNAVGYSPEITQTPVEGPVYTDKVSFKGEGWLSWLQGSIEYGSSGQMSVPVINGVAKVSNGKSLGSAISKSQTTSGKQKGGDTKEKDRYHVIKNLLESLQKDYDEISKARSRAWGDDSLSLIDQEIEKVGQLKFAQEQYLKEIEKYWKKDQAKMNAYGAEYDEYGNITNYDELFKKFGQSDAFQENLSKYEETVDLWADANAELTDFKNQLQDLKYETITVKLDLEIELNDLDKEIANYFFDKMADDVYKTAEAMVYLNEKIDLSEKSMSAYKTSFEELTQAWEDEDGPQISQASYKEGLNEVLDGIMSELEALTELDEKMMDYYGNTIQKANEELSNYTSKLENAAAKLEHFQKVQDLSGKGKDYDFNIKLLDAQVKNAKNSYDVSKKWYEARRADAAQFKKQLDQINEATNPAEYELIKKQYEDAENAAHEAFSTMAADREEFLQLAQSKWQETIEKIVDASSKLLSDGMGLDKMIESMGNISDVADEYLTKTNQIYETNKMMHQLNIDMDKTNNKAAKQRLSNFAKEIKSAEEQNKLSNLELKILQAKYQQLLAQIALEEAQNAKNVVKLSRDNEGNYGYVYTADTNKISEAEQNLAKADNDLYNIRLDGFNSYSEKVVQAQNELLQKLKEINLDETLSEDEKYAEMTRAREEYDEKVKVYMENALVAQKDDARIQADAWAATYSKQILDAENWKTTVDTLTKEFKDNNKAYHTEIDEVVKDTKEGYDTLSEAISGTTDESEKLKKQITEEVIPALEEEIAAVKKEVTAYGKRRDAIQENINKYEDLIGTIRKALQALKEYHAELERPVTPYTDKKDYSGTGDGNGTGGGNPNGDPLEKPMYGDYSNYGKTSSNTKQVTMYYYNSASYNAAYSSKNGLIRALREKYDGKKAEMAIDKIQSRWFGGSGEALELHIASELGVPKQNIHINEKDLKKYDTGGYTGKWGDEGRLALLHEKEIVLNKEDTQNFLAGINILRSISQMIDLNAGAQMTQAATLKAQSIANNSSLLEQQVTIHAEFPNATNHSEIEQAFDTLINRASQYANRK